MNTWKQALWLAKFELKASIVNILLCWLLLTVFSLFFLTSFGGYLENNFVMFDIIFLMFFSFAPYWLKSKHFQYKKVYDHIWASPTLVMQLQLPIPIDALVKSRLIIYLAYLLPFMITIFPLFYLININIQGGVGLSTYIPFFIIWLSYSLYFGFILPASDVGDYISKSIWIHYSAVIIAIFLGIILFFHFYLNKGVVCWTIYLAEKWPVYSIIISIILVIVSWKYWPYYMKKAIKKLDYM